MNYIDYDIKAIRERCKEINELRQKELIEDNLRAGRAVFRPNTAKLTNTPEPTLLQKTLFAWGFPAAYMVRFHTNGELSRDIALPPK